MKNPEEHLIDRAKENLRQGPDKEDRRVRRSRRMLKQGLLELMRSKRFSEISVRDITDLADMNRGTFYLHYPDTTALLRSLEDDMEGEIRAVVDAHIHEVEQRGSMQPVFEPILDYVIANRETCESLFRNNEVSGFFDRLQSLCSKYGRSIIRDCFPLIGEADMTYLLSFVTYGLVALLKTWFEQGMTLPKPELLHMADRLLIGAAEQMA